MFDMYLVTGATGFLGRTIVEELVRRGSSVRALVLHGDPYTKLLPPEADTVEGDVSERDSLAAFFAGAGENTCVLHCAGIISVASRPGQRIYQVNVEGTRNIMALCREHGVGRLVHVSSVHAIPEQPKGTVITEQCTFSPELCGATTRKPRRPLPPTSCKRRRRD